jgi:polyphosphate kinase 2 (PPK2 family)
MSDFKTIDAAILVKPGEKSGLASRDTVRADLFVSKEEAEEATKACSKAIDALQDRLYGEGKRALLVVLQGIDTSGKDGTVRGVFDKCGPLGVRVTPFGKPTDIELAHDYLWRIHAAVPRRGHIGVFNRSHYEDVLIGRVRNLAPPEASDRERHDHSQIHAAHLEG